MGSSWHDAQHNYQKSPLALVAQPLLHAPVNNVEQHYCLEGIILFRCHLALLMISRCAKPHEIVPQTTILNQEELFCFL